MFQPSKSVWKESEKAQFPNRKRFLITNGDLDIHARINRELSDLANSLGRGLEIDNTLVDAHLVTIPGLWTFTIWRLTSSNTQGLGWHADGALDLQKMMKNKRISNLYLQVLVLCSLDEFIGNALDSGAVLRSDGDSNFMLLLLFRGNFGSILRWKFHEKIKFTPCLTLEFLLSFLVGWHLFTCRLDELTQQRWASGPILVWKLNFSLMIFGSVVFICTIETVLITLFLRFWLVTCLFIILDDWAAECIPWHSIETRRICLIRNRICWPANAPWLGNMCQENVCQISMCKCSPMNSIVFTIFILDCSKPKLSIFRGLA